LEASKCIFKSEVTPLPDEETGFEAMTPAIAGKTNCADATIDPPNNNNNVKKYFFLIPILLILILRFFYLMSPALIKVVPDNPIKETIALVPAVFV